MTSTPDDRGPAYQDALERSEAAFGHVRRVLGGQARLIDDAGQLAELAAALPSETPVSVDDVIRETVPGQGRVSAVAVTVTAYAVAPDTPVRDNRGTEYHVLVPGIQLGPVLLPDAEADPGDPQQWKPSGAWDQMLDIQDRGEANEALDAIAAVIDRLRDRLLDEDGNPSGFLTAGSVVPVGIGNAAARLADVAEGLRGLALLAAEEARHDAQDDGTDRIGIAFISRMTGRAPADDEAIGYLLHQQAGEGAALGLGEAWDIRAVRAAHDGTLTAMLAAGGITWQPGQDAAVLSPGMDLGDVARTWSESCDRAAEIIGAVAEETAVGRPAGDGLRDEGAPGRRWVTAADGGPA